MCIRDSLASMPFVKGLGKFHISTPQYSEFNKPSIDSLLCADCVFVGHGRASAGTRESPQIFISGEDAAIAISTRIGRLKEMSISIVSNGMHCFCVRPW